MLAARGYYILMGAAFFAGNIMEACRVKWLLDRLEVKLPFFLKDDVRPPGSRQGPKALFCHCHSFSNISCLTLVQQYCRSTKLPYKLVMVATHIGVDALGKERC